VLITDVGWRVDLLMVHVGSSTSTCQWNTIVECSPVGVPLVCGIQKQTVTPAGNPVAFVAPVVMRNIC
jgi:hypothetical protein